MFGGSSLEVSTHRATEIAVGCGAADRRASLTVDGASISIDSPEAVASLALHVVQAGDPVRIVNVLDAIRPTVKAADPNATFRGFLGAARRSPDPSLTRVLGGVTVLTTARLDGSRDFDLLPDRPDGDSVVDTAGPGANYNPWSGDTFVVMEFTPDPASPVADVDRVIRRTALGTARDLAICAGTGPERVERLPRPDLEADLPAVAVIVHVGAEGPLLDTFFMGRSMRRSAPVLVDPLDVIDGGVVNAAFDWAALRNTTASYQESRLVMRLLRGRGARCAGVVLTRAYLTSYEDKQRNAAAAADLAAAAGARGVVVTTFQSGNSQTDTMLVIEACEDRGMPTVGIVAETDDGLTDHVAAADSLVSVGNEDDRVPGWKPHHTIGGETLLDGEDAASGDPLPIRSYLGALSQLGNTSLQAVPS